MMQRESPPTIWLPEAERFSNILRSNQITYAIFGAGALATHNIIVRPTVDIDFVVQNYDRALNIIKDSSGLESANLQKDTDGIPVSDFYFKSGVSVQIWDNNLYSLPMTDNAWSRVVVKKIPGGNLIRSISIEDLMVAKVGRYIQQFRDNGYEAKKNVTDIVYTMKVLKRPDYKYIVERLKDGARRETSAQSSPIHPLPWFFVREIKTYHDIAKEANFDLEHMRKIISHILAHLKTQSTDYYLLRRLRTIGNIDEFKNSFMLDDETTALLLKRWKTVVKIEDNSVQLTSKDIQRYIDSLGPEKPDYINKLAFSGKQRS